ncbi:MAG: hypothetical protein NE327_13160 [Lentisphaeraceae bacterium]|nr:hypothetical protein [Lentisphaeraceae bacterium]
MVIVNKILNVLIFLLAIAACIAAILLHQRRLELRGRADLLSEVIADVAKKVDGDKDAKTSTEINATDYLPSKDVLNWQEYHKARQLEGENYVFKKFEENVRKLPDDVEKLFTLKKVMADNFIEFARINKGASGLAADAAENLKESLNSTLTFEQNVAPIITKNEKIIKRGEEFAERIVAITKALEKPQDVTNFDIYSDSDTDSNDSLKGSLDQIAKQASDLVSRSQVLAKGYEEVFKGFEPQGENPRYFQPNLNPQAMLSEDQNEIRNAIGTMYKDLVKVNTLLHERAVAIKQVDDLTQQVTVLNNVKEELNKENDMLKNENGRLKAENKRISTQLEELKELYVKDRNVMAPGFAAKVVESNDRFDFVVLNKGKKQGVKNNVEMVVHSNGKYICKVLVTKVLEESCVCDILPITRPKDAQGNYLLPNAGDEAVVPGQ